MIQATAIGNYLRIAPRKMRLVIDTIRNKPIDQAMIQLNLRPKKAARLARSVLKSALANAKVLKMDEGRLVVSEVYANGGPVLKRFRARAMGRGNRILKRMTHVKMILREERQVAKPTVPETKVAKGKTMSKLSTSKPLEKKYMPKKATATT